MYKIIIKSVRTEAYLWASKHQSYARRDAGQTFLCGFCQVLPGMSLNAVLRFFTVAGLRINPSGTILFPETTISRNIYSYSAYFGPSERPPFYMVHDLPYLNRG